MTESINIPDGLPTLSAGAHRPNPGRACVMEYVSLLAGEEWSDAPKCTHHTLAHLAREVNDRMSEEERHQLIPLIGRLFGTDNQDIELDIEPTKWHDCRCGDQGCGWMSYDLADLERAIDQYDRKAGRTEHREVTDAELRQLAAQVAAA